MLPLKEFSNVSLEYGPSDYLKKAIPSLLYNSNLTYDICKDLDIFNQVDLRRTDESLQEIDKQVKVEDTHLLHILSPHFPNTSEFLLLQGVEAKVLL